MAKRKKHHNTALIRSTMFVLLAVALAILGYRTARAWAVQTPYFQVASVTLEGMRLAGDLATITEQVKGKNIFEVDLASLADNTQNAYANIRSVQAHRRFPDSIHLVLDERLPLAQVYCGGVYRVIDRERMLFGPAKAEPYPDLILIEGAGCSLFSAGQVVDREQMVLAIDIIEHIKKSVRLKTLAFKTLDVSSMSNATAYLEDGIEIRIGKGELERKMEVLDALLEQVEGKMDGVRYLDARFLRKPVVGHRKR